MKFTGSTRFNLCNHNTSLWKLTSNDNDYEHWKQKLSELLGSTYLLYTHFHGAIGIVCNVVGE